MLNVHEVVLVVLVSTTILLQRIENCCKYLCQTFLCGAMRETTTYLIPTILFLHFFLLDIFETKELDLNELTRRLNILIICTHSNIESLWLSKL